MVGVLADELLGSIDGLLGPLSELQAEERTELEERLEAIGGRKGDLKKMEAKHNREQRRVRIDELRFGLAVLGVATATQLLDGGSADDFVAVADGVQRLCDGLEHNPRESLALEALLVSLPLLRVGS